MRRIFTLFAVLSLGAVAAQGRFERVARRNPWNGGVVAAGLRQDTLSRSFAEVYFVKENGVPNQDNLLIGDALFYGIYRAASSVNLLLYNPLCHLPL